MTVMSMMEVATEVQVMGMMEMATEVVDVVMVIGEVAIAVAARPRTAKLGHSVRC